MKDMFRVQFYSIPLYMLFSTLECLAAFWNDFKSSNNATKFYIGLPSVDWLGQSNCSMLCSVSHFFVGFALCLRSLSCRKIHLFESYSFGADSCRLEFKISWYFSPFILPFIICMLLVPFTTPKPWCLHPQISQ